MVRATRLKLGQEHESVRSPLQAANVLSYLGTQQAGGTKMLDAPLQILVGGLATILFARRGNRWWLAAGKGVLVSALFSTILGIVLAITAGTDWSKVWRRR